MVSLVQLLGTWLLLTGLCLSTDFVPHCRPEDEICSGENFFLQEEDGGKFEWAMNKRFVKVRDR